MLEDMGTPSPDPFKTNATIRSTPKVSRKEWKEERHPNPNMITRSDNPEHKKRSITDKETGRKMITRHRSPSPPYPGYTKPQLGTKAARKVAPDREHLFHYKLWRQLDISQTLKFTNQYLLAKEDTKYITGTINNEDTIRPGMETIMADSNETGRQIQLKIDLEDKCTRITKVTHPLDKALGTNFHMQMIQVPGHTLDQFGQLVKEVCNAQFQPLNKDQNTS
jgi:hypothetical protein